MMPIIPLLKDVLVALFRKPATVLYPYVKVKAAEGYRGRIEVDWKKCIHCSSCARVCPSAACKFNPKTKKPEFDLRQCVFCGECKDICPVKCIELTQDFEMASGKKKDLIVK